MIDFHCHLDLYQNPQQIAETCKRHGIYVLSVTTTPSAWRGTTALASGAQRIRTALGLHPQLAHERQSELALFEGLLSETQYVGEIGLDGAPEFRAHWSAQLTVFDRVLDACARAGGRILSLHSRHASAAVLDRLEAHRQSGQPVLHWFSGTPREVDRAVSLGCWFSVGPAMLRSDRGRALAARMPRERVLTESDGPFAQRDGKPFLPWEVDQAVQTLAELWSLSPMEAEQVTHRNLRTLTSTARSEE